MATETVLLVDDEKEILQLLSIYFGNEGYRLFTASVSGNGIEYRNGSKPSLHEKGRFFAVERTSGNLKKSVNYSLRCGR